MSLRNALLGIALAVSACASVSAQEGAQISAVCPGAVGPGAPVTAGFTLTGLPPTAAPIVQWSLVDAPGRFSLTADGASATVSGSAPLVPGVYTISAQATYTFSQKLTPTPVGPASCSFEVEAPPPQIIGSCPTATFAPGSSVSIPLQATGGTGRYQWSISSSGASLVLTSTSGAQTLVQGTLGTSAATFTVTLTDVATQSAATLSCTINVTAQPLAVVGSCPTTAFAPGTPISIPLSATGGSGVYSWQLSGGNSGLSLSSGSGANTVIQGTATTSGQYPITVTVTDAATSNRVGVVAATFTCTIVVGAPLQITGTCPTQPILAGATFSLPLSVAGGSGTYTWTATGPFTPSATTGASITLTGTPTGAGNAAITATVKDSLGSSATFNCTVRVVGPLTITGPTCPVGNIVAGAAFTIPLSVSGGTGTYSWTLNGPSFLSQSAASGASISLSGTAPNGGSFPFSVTVSDGLNPPQTFSCSLQVTAPLTLQSASLPDGVVNQVYPSTALNAGGGLAPLSFRVSGGSLPPGLQLSTAGVISGTPTQAGTFPFTVTVTDAGSETTQQSATANYQIIVTLPITNTTTCPLPVGRELQQYNAPLTATGGSGSFTFSLANNSLLPLGLTLNQNAIYGTPQGPSDTMLSLQITSGNQTTAPFTCELKVLGRTPNVTVNGFFVNTNSSLLTSTISLDAPVQQDITGTAVLSFAPDVPNSAIKDNPQVQFCGGNAGDSMCSAAQKDASGLLRIIPFTIPAGTSSLDLSPALTSNVAGTITISLTNVMMGGQSLTVAPLQFTIPRTPPVILADPTASFSGSILNLVMKVSSSTCELSSARAVFSPTSGSELEGGNGGSFTSVIDLTSVFKNFVPFAVDAAHPTGGCAFTLTLPFNISGDAGAIQSVAVTLTNAAGAAPPVTVGLQP